MTSAAESEILTRVGPRTPMGDLMREYWLPAIKSDELAAAGDPIRLKLLGEKLIAFRDSSGKVGVMDHRCPHRCASLFFGRNEEGGIRCVYHGWKFDADGDCLDMANVPPHQDFKHKVHARAYKTKERNGLIWVYMGAVQDAPPCELMSDTGDTQTFQLQNFTSALRSKADVAPAGMFRFEHAINIVSTDRF